MMKSPSTRCLTAIFLLFWMGVYTHGALSHMGRPHFIGGVTSADQQEPAGRFENRSSGIEPCPWSTSGAIYHIPFFTTVDAFFPTLDEATPFVILPRTLHLRINVDPRAPPFRS